jgi:hypothetical protein
VLNLKYNEVELFSSFLNYPNTPSKLMIKRGQLGDFSFFINHILYEMFLKDLGVAVLKDTTSHFFFILAPISIIDLFMKLLLLIGGF